MGSYLMKNLVFLGGEDVSARLEIAKKFINLGYNVKIMGTEQEQNFIGEGICYQKYSFSRGLNIIDDIKTIFELREIFKKKTSKTIIHAFDTKPSMFLPLAVFGLENIKVVRTITGMGRIFSEHNFKNSVLKFIYNIIQKVISSRVDFTIFQNNDDYQYYMTHKLIDKSRAEIVKSSGINLAQFTTNIDEQKLQNLKNELFLDENQKTFILVSRLVKEKGIMNYLEAAKLCYEGGNPYNFLLVGQFDDNSITLEMVNQYSKYVQYLGRREDIKELLSLSNIFVLPTYYREGIPRVLLEASALGLGLIATNMAGCKDVVVNDINGKLVNIKDSQDLYQKMLYMANSDDRLAQFGKNAIAKVKEFDLDVVVSKYDKVYERLA